MLRRQIEHLLGTFKGDGGFTEGLTAERVAKKGINSGREFWSCSDYPSCNGTRNVV